MSTNITMPALSPTMEEGNLAKWLVKEGDSVSAGDVIAEIETDKATMEVEAVDEGVVAKILVPEGSEAVKVNAVIAVLAEEGEDVDSVDASPAPVVTESKPAEMTPPSTTAEKEVAAPASSLAPAAAANVGSRVFATPLARRIAEQGGVQLNALSGSGPNGRIIKADVEKAMTSGSASRGAASEVASLASGMSDSAVLDLFDEASIEKRPHDSMRKVLAERLTESAQSIPSYFVTMECELDILLAARARINADAPKDGEGKAAYKISVNDFIIKAMAMALKAVPMANVSWTSTDRIFHQHADIGVAVAVDDGLFTPIVRQAELKTLSVISAEVKDMAARARSKRLKPQEYQGGCTAISNLGMFGVREFTSIINPPHASILSVGAGEKRAVVRGEELAIATVMSATFAFDHRAIDGALGAQLASAFKGYIENPMAMLV